MEQIFKKTSQRKPSRSWRGGGGGGKRRPMGGGNRGPGGGGSRPHSHHNAPSANIPPVGDNIRIIPLGGVEEVGKNMTAFEIGQDIIVIDAGLQFRTQDTPGIDYIIPNTKYLEERKDRVRAMIITHGHLDHIGGIPYVMGKIGNPPLFTRELTAIMIKKRQEEFPQLKPLDMKIVEKDERIQVGNLKIKFFGVTHSIPDSMGVMIETPYGNIVATGDLRVDNNAGVPTEEEDESYGKLSKEKNLLLLADSTNAENPGFSLSERLVIDNIEQVIREAKGRLIIGTFASQLQRIMRILEILEKLGKKVIIEGRSMKSNIEIVQKMNMLKLQPGTIIPVDEVENYPENRIVVIATGSQGEEFAAIMRMSNKTHKYFRVKKGDTVLLSSSIIPGNELGVQKIKDNLSRQGAKIISYRISQIHASGHANKDELAWIHRKIGAKFFIPIHGYHYMLSTHADIARSTGTPDENIVIPDNGMIIEIKEAGAKIVALKEKAPSSPVMVDGFSVGDVQEVVIRDRQMLAQDGMFVVIATVDANTGKLKKSPDLISRGFVYLKENQELLQQSRLIIKKTVETGAQGQHPIDFDFIKADLADNISKFLFQKTAKRPLVIPVILSV
jgi:ribonuclease J